jgi:DNA-binding beta-propeller fold protein YncE
MRRLPTIWLTLISLALLACLAAPALAQDVHAGKLLGVFPDKHAIVVAENQMKSWQVFDLAKDAKVLINNIPSDPMNLRTGEDVIVVYDRDMDRLVATEVRVTRQEPAP